MDAGNAKTVLMLVVSRGALQLLMLLLEVCIARYCTGRRAHGRQDVRSRLASTSWSAVRQQPHEHLNLTRGCLGIGGTGSCSRMPTLQYPTVARDNSLALTDVRLLQTAHCSPPDYLRSKRSPKAVLSFCTGSAGASRLGNPFIAEVSHGQPPAGACMKAARLLQIPQKEAVASFDKAECALQHTAAAIARLYLAHHAQRSFAKHAHTTCSRRRVTALRELCKLIDDIEYQTGGKTPSRALAFGAGWLVVTHQQLLMCTSVTTAVEPRSQHVKFQYVLLCIVQPTVRILS